MLCLIADALTLITLGLLGQLGKVNRVLVTHLDGRRGFGGRKAEKGVQVV